MSDIAETTDLTVHEPQAFDVMSVIERAASNPDVDVTKMQALIDMKMQVMDKEAEIAFNKAMTELRKEMEPIVKNKTNNQTKSKYANLEAIKTAVDPLLIKHGFFDSYDDDFPEDGVIVTACILTHEGGHARRNKVRFKRDNVGIQGSKNKTDVHGDASAMTYGQRLSLCRALGIRIAEDDDGNNAGKVYMSDQQAQKIKDMLKETGKDTKEFLELFDAASVDEMMASDYRKAVALLTMKKELNNADKT